MVKILLVEDLEHLRELMKMQLEMHDFIVDVAVDLKTAAQKIEHGSYDVILLDVRLPDGNSITLFDKYAEKLTSKAIIVTANPTIPGVVNAIKKGAFNYLEKPVEEELLIAQVKKVVEISTPYQNPPIHYQRGCI
ncbi:MAG: response regulator [bacterium]|nr:response regulator [bacterium]